MHNMADNIIEEYWTISNVKGGKRRFDTREDAIDSTKGKVPTRYDNMFHLEHHMVTRESISPNEKLPEQRVSYELIKPVIEEIKQLLTDYKGEYPKLIYDDSIFYIPAVVVATGFPGAKYVTDPMNIVNGIFSDEFFSQATGISLCYITTNHALSNGPTIKVNFGFWELFIQVRPHNICLQRTWSYGHNVSLRSWEYIYPSQLRTLVNKNIKSIKNI